VNSGGTLYGPFSPSNIEFTQNPTIMVNSTSLNFIAYQSEGVALTSYSLNNSTIPNIEFIAFIPNENFEGQAYKFSEDIAMFIYPASSSQAIISVYQISKGKVLQNITFSNTEAESLTSAFPFQVQTSSSKPLQLAIVPGNPPILVTAQGETSNLEIAGEEETVGFLATNSENSIAVLINNECGLWNLVTLQVSNSDKIEI